MGKEIGRCVSVPNARRNAGAWSKNQRSAMNTREFAKIIARIESNVELRPWKCLVPGCEVRAIRSHLLQRKGIVSNLTEDNHLMEFRVKHISRQGPSNNWEFAREGVKRAFWEPLYCSQHDTDLFRSIEQGPVDFTKYRSQMLFLYRALCSELRKKVIVLEKQRRFLGAHTLAGIIDAEYIESAIKGTELGIQDLERIRLDQETDLQAGSETFSLRAYQYPFMPICAAALFTPVQRHVEPLSMSEPWSSVMICVIPIDGKLMVITGCHKQFANDWTRAYIDSWADLSQLQFEEKLTDLLATRTNTWCIGPALYKALSRQCIQQMLDYWDEHAQDLSAGQVAGFNMFKP